MSRKRLIIRVHVTNGWRITSITVGSRQTASAVASQRWHTYIPAASSRRRSVRRCSNRKCTPEVDNNDVMRSLSALEAASADDVCCFIKLPTPRRDLRLLLISWATGAATPTHCQHRLASQTQATNKGRKQADCMAAGYTGRQSVAAPPPPPLLRRKSEA